MSNLSTKVKLYLQANGKTGEEMGVPHEPNTKVIIAKDGNTPEKIEKWNVDGLEQPTTSQLDAFESEATKLENNAKIDVKRRTEYLSWQEQLEMIYKDEKNGTTTYKDHCDKVRSDNPKE